MPSRTMKAAIVGPWAEVALTAVARESGERAAAAAATTAAVSATVASAARVLPIDLCIANRFPWHGMISPGDEARLLNCQRG
jgi:hypothetical protein